MKLLETQLGDFAGICGADEVVLFEKATFLVISHVSTLRFVLWISDFLKDILL